MPMRLAQTSQYVINQWRLAAGRKSVQWQCRHLSRAVRLHSVDQVVVPVGSSGEITLEIDRKSLQQSNASNSSNPFVNIHLPRLPLDVAHLAPESVGSSNSLNYAQSQSTNAVDVTIHYRLSPARPFPSVIHDVLAGYDWVVQNLETLHPDPVDDPSVSVTGTHIGGTLALMLALTECRMSEQGQPEPGGITLANVTDPIVNWLALGLGMAENGVKGANNSDAIIALDNAEEGRSTLQSLRAELFPRNRPATWFDPFASPLLFLRTPGADVPSRNSKVTALEKDLSELALADGEPAVSGVGIEWAPPSPEDDAHVANEPSDVLDADGVHEHSGRTDVAATPTSPDPTSTLLKPPKPPQRRKVPYKWPPPDRADLAIPDVHMHLSRSSVGVALRPQCEEFVRLLRRAIVKQWRREAERVAEGSAVRRRWPAQMFVADGRAVEFDMLPREVAEVQAWAERKIVLREQE